MRFRKGADGLCLDSLLVIIFGGPGEGGALVDRYAASVNHEGAVGTLWVHHFSWIQKIVGVWLIQGS